MICFESQIYDLRRASSLAVQQFARTVGETGIVSSPEDLELTGFTIATVLRLAEALDEAYQATAFGRAA